MCFVKTGLGLESVTFISGFVRLESIYRYVFHKEANIALAFTKENQDYTVLYITVSVMILEGKNATLRLLDVYPR